MCETRIMQDVDRPRAHSAPSMVTLSTRTPSHAQYKKINNQLQEIQLLNGSLLQNGFSKTHHHPTGFSSGRIHMTGNTKGIIRASSSRLQQRRRTLSRALSISQEQKEKIELKYVFIFIILFTFVKWITSNYFQHVKKQNLLIY